MQKHERCQNHPTRTARQKERATSRQWVREGPAPCTRRGPGQRPQSQPQEARKRRQCVRRGARGRHQSTQHWQRPQRYHHESSQPLAHPEGWEGGTWEERSPARDTLTASRARAASRMARRTCTGEVTCRMRRPALLRASGLSTRGTDDVVGGLGVALAAREAYESGFAAGRGAAAAGVGDGSGRGGTTGTGAGGGRASRAARRVATSALSASTSSRGVGGESLESKAANAFWVKG